ncbi:MAG: hypothetical protein WCC06_12110 [Candidatus Aminicenantales bacterium]
MSRIKYSSLIVAAIFLLSAVGFGQGLQAKREITFSVVVAPYIEIITEPIDWSQTTSVNFAYANCPFMATIGGENPGKNPALSRVTFSFNNREHDFVDWTNDVTEFPVSRSYYEAPHNGQVRLNIYLRTGAPAGPSPKLTITLTPL